MKKGILFLILFFLVVCKGTGQILQGYVKTLEEKPVSQAHVILLNSDLKVIAHAVSDDDGFFFTGRDSYAGFTGIPFIGFCCKCK